MKERPILFSAPMVRALLAGTKTQTRRVVKSQPEIGEIAQVGHMLGFKKRGADGYWLWPNARERILSECPYGVPGDRLWVRERFQPLLAEGLDFRQADWKTGKGYAPRYVATDGAVEWIDPDDNISSASKPSIHMPRWACRLVLEITDVRVERLNAISEADCRAEGLGNSVERAHHWFRVLWEDINGPGSWDANPWVWVVSFRLAPP